MADEDVVVIGEMPGADDDAPSDAVTIVEDDENPLPKHAVRNDDGTVTLPLRFPVTLKWKKAGSNTISEDLYDSLTMRRLVGRDMIRMQAAPRDELGLMSIALSAGLAPHKFRPVYERMDGSDIAAASQVVSHFLGSGPKTGR